VGKRHFPKGKRCLPVGKSLLPVRKSGNPRFLAKNGKKLHLQPETGLAEWVIASHLEKHTPVPRAKPAPVPATLPQK